MSIEAVVLFREDRPGEFRKVTLEPLADGLQVFCHDIGDTAEKFFGNRELECATSVELRHLGKLAFHLLAERLAGRADAESELKQFCERYEIPCNSHMWA